MLVSCPNCQVRLNVPNAAPGQVITCPQCQSSFPIATPAMPVAQAVSNPLSFVDGPPSIQQSRMPLRRDRGGGSLFDLQFSSFISPWIIRLIYILSMAAFLIGILATAVWTVLLLRVGGEEALPVVIPIDVGVVLGSMLWLLCIRVSLESVMVLFKIEEYLELISRK